MLNTELTILYLEGRALHHCDSSNYIHSLWSETTTACISKLKVKIKICQI